MVKFIQKLTEKAFLAFWEIKETEQELLELLGINATDEKYLSEIHHSTKRLEFLAGRLLTKILVTHLGEYYEGIERLNSQKPILVNSAWEISLSHSQKYVGVILHYDCQVGIDIEKPSDKVMKILPKFMKDNEIALFSKHLECLTWAWSAKEVLFKIYHKGNVDFKKNLHIDEVFFEQKKLSTRIEMPDCEASVDLFIFELGECHVCYGIADTIA